MKKRKIRKNKVKLQKKIKKANPKLIRFIKDALKKAYSKEYIIKGLLAKGWPNSEITLAFREVKKTLPKKEINHKEKHFMFLQEHLGDIKKPTPPITKKHKKPILGKPIHLISKKPKKKEIKKQEPIKVKNKQIQKPKRKSIFLFELPKKGKHNLPNKNIHVEHKKIIHPDKNKLILKNKKIITKDHHKIDNKKSRPALGLLIIFIFLGTLASYYFKDLYAYIISGAIIILQIIYVSKKPKKKEIKKQEPIKSKKLSISKKVYVTDFDKFYDYILQKKETSISQLAKTFKINKKLAEEWAEILEEKGLIKIHYPVIGEPKLKSEK